MKPGQRDCHSHQKVHSGAVARDGKRRLHAMSDIIEHTLRRGHWTPRIICLNSEGRVAVRTRITNFRMLAGAALGASIFFCQIAVAQAGNVTIEPGPDFGVKVITPWGNFVGVPEGDAIWVGTEANYLKQRAIGISRENGFRVIRPQNEPSNTTEFVSAGLPSTVVGNDDIGGISTTILFGAPPDRRLRRTPIPTSDERVSIVWTPSQPRPVQARIYDNASKMTFAPYTCGMTEGFAHCEWAIPRKALTDRVVIVFTRRGDPPGMVRGASIAKLQYAALVDKYKPIGGLSMPLDRDDRSAVAHLNALDRTIPTTVPGAEIGN